MTQRKKNYQNIHLKNLELQRKKIRNYIIKHAGIVSTEEVFHHWQTREVLSKIINSDLIKSLKLPYVNYESSIYEYELFDDTTKEFIRRFKNDIQNINNGKLSADEFKFKVGKSNFNLFAQTANRCVTDRNVNQFSKSNFTNSVSVSKYIDNIFPDNKKYNAFGKVIVAKMFKTSENRSKFLERKSGISPSAILNNGKILESRLQNRQKDIHTDYTR